MKTNEEPKVLYLQPDSSHSAGKRYLNLNKVSDNDIEYIRKDAFIEKAVTYLKATLFNEVCYGEIRPDIVQAYINDFKKAMKL